MKSFLSDRTRVVAPSVALGAAGFPAAGLEPYAKGHGHTEHAGVTPQIECIREGDRITRMIVLCACGERIEIDCLYAQGK